MAGKSTFLRQNALIAIMAQAGSFVPARSARVGVVDKVFCRVGASDDLLAGYSTFMMEMSETAHILQKATKRSLVIVDEVGRGTSSEDGKAIAQAILEELLRIKPRTLFATHFHQLAKEIQSPNIRLMQVAVDLDSHGKLIFKYKVEPGAALHSYGVQVADLAGIPASVIRRATQLLAAS
jgi:DNA mismatch repair protein MutS